ncbi:HAD-IC family P-type ATPase [Neoactinobaculum massilliense]|uniref:HAD-IC family P-type ATPase n=1 Tax=Neoactinobaculum massilliense TaxID=2364794 RepID=UPI000F544050|nr:HAD-IC family P-type ATPase [Neoactinobaculum massilliense]
MTQRSATRPTANTYQADPTRGLTAAQVVELTAAGKSNALPARSGRTTWQIVRDNVFTRINVMLGVLFVLVLTTGSWINALFGLLIFFNSIIGIIQELRAKKTLDSLAVLGEAQPTVRRDGTETVLPRDAVVLGDIVTVRPGDQVVVDGEVTEAAYLEVDESLLTGESDPIAKQPGDRIMSGSFVASGTGSYRATAVGADAYAAQLTAQASKFSLVDSKLQSGINWILRVITWVLIPVGILTIIGQIRVGAGDYRSTVLAVTGALVPMIPEGLVLITSTAFALGVIRLGRFRVLVNELPAIEGLARVDVVATDKTGTLTENRLTWAGLIPLGDAHEAEIREVLAQLGAADAAPNTSMQAIIAAVGAPAHPWQVRARQPFSSAKKWSGVSFARDGHRSHAGNWVLGAPDVLLDFAEGFAAAKEEAARIAATGQRVLLLGQAAEPVRSPSAPGRVVPLGLVLLDQKVRPDAAATLAYFNSQDVAVKVVSGDNAEAVGAVTRSLGLEVGEPVDMRHVSDADFARTVNNHAVFGRVTPEQKRKMVAALQQAGHTVAMTGDGVNDVLALKDADLGVAMGSGTSATRSVAKVVLLNDHFSALPRVVAEGRRVIGNIERVARLFLTKTVYSALLALLILLWALPYPFQPIHVTITGWFTIGIPAFVLALPPNNDKARDGFVERVMRFGFPAGIAVALVTFLTYIHLYRADATGAYHTQVATATLLALIITCSWVLAVVARPYTWWKVALVLLPVAGYGIIFMGRQTQRFFQLDSSNGPLMAYGAVLGVIGAALVELIWWVLGWKFGERTHLWMPASARRALREQERLRAEA